MRNDIALHSVNGDHYLVHRYCERCRRWLPAQGDINGNCGCLILLGLVSPGFDSHGLHRFDLSGSNKSGASTAGASRVAAITRANHDYSKAIQTIFKDT
jgi:hypothetical protein